MSCCCCNCRFCSPCRPISKNNYRYSQVCKVPLHYLRKLTNLTLLFIVTATQQLSRYQKLSQLFKTAQTPFSVDTLFAGKAQNVFRHSSHSLIKLFLKVGTVLLIRPAENCSLSSPVLLIIQKLFCAVGLRIKVSK